MATEAGQIAVSPLTSSVSKDGSITEGSHLTLSDGFVLQEHPRVAGDSVMGTTGSLDSYALGKFLCLIPAASWFKLTSRSQLHLWQNRADNSPSPMGHRNIVSILNQSVLRRSHDFWLS